MPNGWYPVPGLDVVLINRTEQRYPRIEWSQSWDSFSAVQINGPKGFTPLGALRFPWGTDPDPFERLVESTRELITNDKGIQGCNASVAHVNFKTKVGWAAGSFCVYGFKEGKVTVLHDHTLGAHLPPGIDMGEYKDHLSIAVTMVDATGLVVPRDPPAPEWRFDFAGMDSLVVSGAALHYDAHWPPKTSLDCVVIELAKTNRRDTLVALWKPDES